MRNRRFKTNTSQSGGTWLVLSLLLVTVLLPTVCLLWFMTQAVKNERLAVRQKLIDMYTKRAQVFFVEDQDLYFNDQEYLQSLISHIPEGWFDSVLASSHLPGILAFDRGGKIIYPITNASAPEASDELIEALQHELNGRFEEAIRQYETIAKTADTETVRYQAVIAQARCLAKTHRTQTAVDLIYNLSYPSHPESVGPPLAAAVMRCRVFLAQRYSETKNKRLFYHLRRTLGNARYGTGDSRYGKEVEDGYLQGPADTTIWYLDSLIAVARQAGLTDRLDREIQLAEHRMAACQISLDAADAYPTADSLKDWPVNTVRRLAPERDLYGLKFTLADKTIVGISTFDRLLRLIIAAVHDMQDNMVGVRVYDNFGQCIIGDAGLEGKPFMTLTPGKYLPDFKVDVFFRDHSVFENAASRQTAVYTWTGILVVVLIVTSGTLAARAIGRQAKLNRLKNDFIATISHELKTPLSSMRVLVDTLLEGRYRDQTQATEYLQLVSKENQRLSRLIDNFLTFSRMERNKRAFEFAEVEPNDIVRDAVGTIRDRFESAGCRLNIELASELPTINADRDAMVTVLLNLLDNAYKYSENDKQITIRTYSTDRSVCFEVADKGIGLSRRDTKRVFNRFYQVDQSLSRRTGGCGLGLSIVKFIVDAHGGTIDVQSRLGQGSTFAVTLPAEICNMNI